MSFPVQVDIPKVCCCEIRLDHGESANPNIAIVTPVTLSPTMQVVFGLHR